MITVDEAIKQLAVAKANYETLLAKAPVEGYDEQLRRLEASLRAFCAKSEIELRRQEAELAALRACTAWLDAPKSP